MNKHKIWSLCFWYEISNNSYEKIFKQENPPMSFKGGVWLSGITGHLHYDYWDFPAHIRTEEDSDFWHSIHGGIGRQRRIFYTFWGFTFVSFNCHLPAGTSKEKHLLLVLPRQRRWRVGLWDRRRRKCQSVGVVLHRLRNDDYQTRICQTFQRCKVKPDKISIQRDLAETEITECVNIL